MDRSSILRASTTTCQAGPKTGLPFSSCVNYSCNIAARFARRANLLLQWIDEIKTNRIDRSRNEQSQRTSCSHSRKACRATAPPHRRSVPGGFCCENPGHVKDEPACSGICALWARCARRHGCRGFRACFQPWRFRAAQASCGQDRGGGPRCDRGNPARRLPCGRRRVLRAFLAEGEDRLF